MFESIEEELAVIHEMRKRTARITFETADLWAHCTYCDLYDEEEMEDLHEHKQMALEDLMRVNQGLLTEEQQLQYDLVYDMLLNPQNYEEV